MTEHGQSKGIMAPGYWYKNVFEGKMIVFVLA
jgi:hypothetical protein